jgi:hypothetical protein
MINDACIVLSYPINFWRKKRPCVNGRLVGHKEQVERGYKYKWVLLGIVTPIFANAPQKKKKSITKPMSCIFVKYQD